MDLNVICLKASLLTIGIIDKRPKLDILILDFQTEADVRELCC